MTEYLHAFVTITFALMQMKFFFPSFSFPRQYLVHTVKRCREGKRGGGINIFFFLRLLSHRRLIEQLSHVQPAYTQFHPLLIFIVMYRNKEGEWEITHSILYWLLVGKEKFSSRRKRTKPAARFVHIRTRERERQSRPLPPDLSIDPSCQVGQSPVIKNKTSSSRHRLSTTCWRVSRTHTGGYFRWAVPEYRCQQNVPIVGAHYNLFRKALNPLPFPDPAAKIKDGDDHF